MKTMKLILVALIALQISACAPLLIGGAATTGVIVAQDRRTAGTILNDQRTEVRVRNFIAQDKGLSDHTRLKVNSYNGIVLITGETASQLMANQIINFAKAEPHVREVRNELRIGALSDTATRRSDFATGNRLRTRLTSNPDVKSLTVRFVVDQGTVYLMGLVTRAEAEQIVEATRTVDGVKRVVRMFEYVQPDP